MGRSGSKAKKASLANFEAYGTINNGLKLQN